jgi:alpha-L-rhamnosidase
MRRLFATNLGELENYIIDTGYDWGEWLRPGEGFGGSLFNIIFATGTVATAYFAHSAALLAQIASILEKGQDAERYGELAGKVKDAWRAAFLRDDGRRIGDDKQDDYVRAIAFDLLSTEEKKLAIDRLAQLIEKADFHVGTGFLSTTLLLPVLADNGRADLAFRLLFQETHPSWLYMVNLCSTTFWVSWY